RGVGGLEEIVGEELGLGARLRVVEDRAQLLQVPRPQQVVDVGERRFRERAQRLAFDDDEVMAAHALRAHAIGGELAVGRGVGAQREKRGGLLRRGGGGGGGAWGFLVLGEPTSRGVFGGFFSVVCGPGRRTPRLTRR